MKAFILDGGKSKFAFLGAEEEARLKETLVSKVIKALEDSGYVDEIILITTFEGVPTGDRFSKIKIVRTTAGKSITDNIKLGLGQINNHKEHALFCTSDLPLINGKLIDKFIKQSLELCADIVYPVIPRKSVERLSKNTKRTFINLKNGSYTGGNLFLVNMAVLKNIMPNIELVYSLRKNPKKIVKTIGILFIIKLILRQLPIKELEKRCTDLLKAKCRALVTSDAELGMDVDKESDLTLV